SSNFSSTSAGLARGDLGPGLDGVEPRLASGFFGLKIPAPPPNSPPVSCACATPAQMRIDVNSRTIKSKRTEHFGADRNIFENPRLSDEQITLNSLLLERSLGHNLAN